MISRHVNSQYEVLCCCWCYDKMIYSMWIDFFRRNIICSHARFGENNLLWFLCTRTTYTIAMENQIDSKISYFCKDGNFAHSNWFVFPSICYLDVLMRCFVGIFAAPTTRAYYSTLTRAHIMTIVEKVFTCDIWWKPIFFTKFCLFEKNEIKRTHSTFR